MSLLEIIRFRALVQGAAILLALACIMCCAARGDEFARIRAIAEITTLTESQGSGTLVATNGKVGLVLTCRHVAEKTGNLVLVRWPAAGNQASTGVVVEVIPGKEFNTDGALVMVERPIGVDPVPYARFNPDDGPHVAMGYRGGFLRSQTGSAQEKDGVIYLNQIAVGGMSGGPLFNKRGEISGVVVASNQFVSLSFDGDLLAKMLAKFQKKP